MTLKKDQALITIDSVDIDRLCEGVLAKLPSDQHVLVQKVLNDLLLENEAGQLNALEPHFHNQPAKQTAFHHALHTALILAEFQADGVSRASALLMALPLAKLNQTDQLSRDYGKEVSQLVRGALSLVRLTQLTRQAQSHEKADVASQKEMLRKMLLAMAADLRIVLIRLGSRLQTLRWHAAHKIPCDLGLAKETLELYAPLASRLGIWQIKWEIEDLAFRFTEPETYKKIAKQLEEKRVERETFIRETVAQLQASLKEMGIDAEVSGRPKHIFSIWNKMRNKHLDFSALYDLRALRVIVPEDRHCYEVLALVHQLWSPVSDEFDDYIARPKPNGYRSLHTVLSDRSGRAFEVQIRTLAMHEYAEFGMAAHWRYKEAGPKGGQAVTPSQHRDLAWMRQLLAWNREVIADPNHPNQPVSPSEHIYVLSPLARVIELPVGATPVDFAYQLHTDLGHRCRGAKVDGQMVPLQTRLQTGQTVEIIATKSGGPSRDWVNAQLGYLSSPRARAKVRAWFNAIELQQRITQGQAHVEKELQRLGKTAVNLEHLAAQLGFTQAEDLYVAVAKDDFSVKLIDTAFRLPIEPEPMTPESLIHMSPKHDRQHQDPSSGVLVVGVGSLLTQLARCCRPAPPDLIKGFVTRGRGVSIHRIDCPSFVALTLNQFERVIDVSWGQTLDTVYPVDMVVFAQDRSGLLRDLSEVFARLKMNVVGVNTQSKSSLANMVFTVEISHGDDIQRMQAALLEVSGVEAVHRH
jgi:GTP pyrophosphokinase